jgi:single-strand DNA-binding protein
MLEKADPQESDMAEGLNKVMLLGNLGADPELRVTPSGQSILKLRLATTESYLDKGGTRQERTEWHRVTVWGKRGEALSKILAKGSTIFVDGRIQTSSYEKNGEKRYSTDIVANNIILAGRGRAGGAESGYEGGGGRSERAYGGGGGGSPSGGARAPAAAPAAEEEPADAFSGGGGFDADDDIPF